MFSKFLIAATMIGSALAAPAEIASAYPKRAAEFDLWKAKYAKEYSSVKEEAKRFLVWLDTALSVEEHNAQQLDWTRAVNQFADQTPEEFNSWANGLKFDADAPRTGTPFQLEVSAADLPTSVDWRKKGIVNAVKNQAQCGSCWAFSTIASFEGQYALKHNLTSFSEQDLVDCVKGVNGCCNGCQGGLMDPAFEYMKAKQEGDDDTEKAYGYTAADGTCTFKQGIAEGGITGHVDIPPGNQAALKQAVATVGVISVGVDASKGWQTYAGGVYTPILPGIIGCSSNPGSMDHGVAVVGYNTDTFNGKKKDYWIVRNSWAESWGEQGYMYLSMDKNNACGIANTASYPQL
jgi:cathepsin L